MTAPVPAHGAVPTYTEVDAAAYAAHAERQRAAAAHPAAAAPAPPPAEAPTAPPGAVMAEMQAEVATEQEPADPEYPPGAVAVPLVGRDGTRDVIHILPGDQWTSEGFSAMQPRPVPDYELWAEDCLAGDDYEQVWRRLRPTMGGIAEMLEAFYEVTGMDAGKARTQQRFSRRTPRR